MPRRDPEARRHLPLNAVAERLTEQGHWLLTQQPSRALATVSAMQSHFDRVTDCVRSRITEQLAELDPGIPIWQAPVQVRQPPAPTLDDYWLLDPVDGAVQYLSGLPLWTISLCRIHAGRPILALIHEPANGTLWQAQLGQGASRNGLKLHCQDREPLSLAVIGTSFPNYPPRPQAEVDRFLRTMAQTVPKVFAQRWMGPASLSLAQVGAGLLDGYWELDGSCFDWLAGALVAMEAGAVVTGSEGQALTWACTDILASSPSLAADLRELMQSAH